jgi:uncharacterized membrane protein YidH (DUF202 family)
MEKEESNQQRQRKEAEQDSDPRVDLAVERTEYALERTQLAWIRTVLSLLGGGIALDKGVEAIHKARIETGNSLVDSAHAIGIALSITGTLLMVITSIFYIRRSQSLAKIKGTKPVRIPPGVLASILIILLGVGISFLLLVS